MAATNARFPDRWPLMFGREPDIEKLLARCSPQAGAPDGVTFLCGRPKTGKSWLLEELGRRLERAETLVGYAESTGTTDLVLWAVADAYQQWFTSSTWREQGRSLFERHRSGLVGKVGEVVAAVAEQALTGAAVGSGIRSMLTPLVAADQDLRTGGLELTPMPYAVARDLAAHLHALTNKPLVLMLDAWEQSPHLSHEVAFLSAYLRNTEDWPPCHFIVGVRVDDQESKAVVSARTLSSAEPYADTMLLTEMSLGSDVPEASRLLAYLRDLLGATVSTPENDELLSLVAGYPGVVDFWRAAVRRGSALDRDRLRALADDAHVSRYRDLELDLERVLSKDPEAANVAIQLALLPRVAAQSDWDTFRSVLQPQEGLDDAVAALQQRGVLDTANLAYGSFGHATRHESARRWCLSKARPTTRRVAIQLLPQLAGRVRSVDPSVAPFVLALAGFASDNALASLDLPPSERRLAQLARTLVTDQPPVPEVHDLDREARGLNGTFPMASGLLAMVLFNTLNQAKAEGALARRDALLEVLRVIAMTHPAEACAQEQLARALFNTLNDAKAEDALERRDAILKELRALATAHPANADVRESLARGLFNTLIDSKAEGALERRDALLEDLRALATAYPADAAVRERLAKGLVNTLSYAGAEGALARRDVLLEELRALATAHLVDAPLRDHLARALVNTLIDSKAEDALARRDALLDDLRTLATAYPSDAAVRKWLVMGLSCTLNDATPEGAPARRDALLDELRVLANDYPADAAAREWLAKGIFNTLIDANTEGALARRDALVEELRDLATGLPAHSEVQALLAEALYRSLSDETEDGTP